MTTLSSPIDRRIYARVKYRMMKWLVPGMCFANILLCGARILMGSPDGFMLLSSAASMACFVYFFWFGGLLGFRSISISGDTITLCQVSTSRSIQVDDIDPVKSLRKNGVVRLSKKSAPYHDLIEIVPSAITDPDTRSRILEAIERGMAG